MKLDTNPSPRVLRQFSVAAGAFAALSGYIVFGNTESLRACGAIWAAGVIVVVLGLARPPAVRPVYLILNVIAMPIGMVISTFLLAVVYYLVVTPIGLLMRLAGHDPLQRQSDPTAKTYWLKREVAKIQRYFRQF